jgi:hypothetical protein
MLYIISCKSGILHLLYRLSKRYYYEKIIKNLRCSTLLKKNWVSRMSSNLKYICLFFKYTKLCQVSGDLHFNIVSIELRQSTSRARPRECHMQVNQFPNFVKFFLAGNLPHGLLFIIKSLKLYLAVKVEFWFRKTTTVFVQWLSCILHV